MITVIPAIDLQGGRCVRLRQGRPEESTVYSDDPGGMAAHWVAEGGRMLHVVDLDGAFEGRPVHREQIGAIVRAAGGVPVEAGGGIRTDEDIEAMLGLGLRRVIVGTRACGQGDWLASAVERWGDRLAVGIDARGGWGQVTGWAETTGVRATELASRVAGMGVSTIIYTDTARDGMLEGVNADAMGAVCDVACCDVVASGGVSTPGDMRRLAALGRPNLVGAIVGKALYEGSVTVRELVQEGDTDAGSISG